MRQREDKEREWRHKTFTIGIIGGLVGAVLLAGFAGFQWRQANEQCKESDKQRQFALARQLAVQADQVRNQSASLLTVSVLLATEGLQRLSPLETDQAIHGGLTLLPLPLHDLKHEDAVIVLRTMMLAA